MIEKLTRRELEVVTELARDGATNQEIADRLRLSPKTVKIHVGTLMVKTGIRTRAGLAVWYLRNPVCDVCLTPFAEPFEDHPDCRAKVERRRRKPSSVA